MILRIYIGLMALPIMTCKGTDSHWIFVNSCSKLVLSFVIFCCIMYMTLVYRNFKSLQEEHGSILYRILNVSLLLIFMIFTKDVLTLAFPIAKAEIFLDAMTILIYYFSTIFIKIKFSIF